MNYVLWRVEGSPAHIDSDAWQRGVTLHLLYQPLTTISVRRGGEERRYLMLAGCAQCRPDGCGRMCHRSLFEQLVRTSMPGLSLTPVARLPPPPDERRRLVAAPKRADARPLGAEFLRQWEAGRVVTTWSRLRAEARPVRVGARLSLAAPGPDPAAALRERGWQARPIDALLTGPAFCAPVPPPVSGGARAGEPLLDALRDPRQLAGVAPTYAEEG